MCKPIKKQNIVVLSLFESEKKIKYLFKKFIWFTVLYCLGQIRKKTEENVGQ